MTGNVCVCVCVCVVLTDGDDSLRYILAGVISGAALIIIIIIVVIVVVCRLHKSNTDSGCRHMSTLTCFLVMAALRSRCGHYIFALWFLSSSFFIPRLISAAADWMSTILPHMVWP